jgi:hypothetical protein
MGKGGANLGRNFTLVHIGVDENGWILASKVPLPFSIPTRRIPAIFYMPYYYS